jgi:hypothetical protein
MKVEQLLASNHHKQRAIIIFKLNKIPNRWQVIKNYMFIGRYCEVTVTSP